MIVRRALYDLFGNGYKVVVMLSELDSCILGVVWRGGPMSAYGVRAHFAGSHTTTWSSSTGTVYPAIRRLREAGYLKAGDPTGPRKRELLSLTSKGRRALDNWLMDVRPEFASSTADPIRTRVHFLSALKPSARPRVFDAYRAATRSAMARVQAALDQEAVTAVDRSERLGNLGALAELKARLEWLNVAERELSREL